MRQMRMKIGELARATGLTAKTIRFHEHIELLDDPGRTESGYRQYGAEDVESLEFIKKAKRLGLSLDEIRDILKIRALSQSPCVHVLAPWRPSERLQEALGDSPPSPWCVKNAWASSDELSGNNLKACKPAATFTKKGRVGLLTLMSGSGAILILGLSHWFGYPKSDHNPMAHLMSPS